MMTREGSSAAAELLSSAATLVVTGVVVASYAYQEHELKKHEAAIAAIETLYKRYLARIEVAGYQCITIVKLPPIFDEGTSDNPQPKTVLQIDILEDLYKKIPIYNDPHLRDYGHHILNAMRKLAEFYDRRLSDRSWFYKGEKTDITSSVLSYLILMLSEHCIKFEGYNVDIAYLDSLAQFVNAFASLEAGHHRERFEQLTEAYSELGQAKRILMDHSLSLSMEELVSQFESDCGNACEAMIRIFAKLIMPNNKWEAVDFASIDLLAQGMVKPLYYYTNGNRRASGKPMLLPDCMFSDWLKQIAKNYLDSLPVAKGTEMSINDQPFSLPNLIEKSQQEQRRKIKAVFASSSNVLTLTVAQKKEYEGVKQFTAVRDPEDIQKRSAIYFQLYQLMDHLVVAQYFCSHIWRQIKQLGEKYVTDSQDCDFIFAVLKGLGAQIKALGTQLSNAMETVQQDCQGAMRRDQENDLAFELQRQLDGAKDRIAVAIFDIVDKHHVRRQQEQASVNQTINIQKADKLLTLTAAIRAAYQIETEHQLSSQEKEDQSSPQPDQVKNKRRADASIDSLYLSIQQMRQFGVSLTPEDQAKGAMVVALANQLEDKLDDFAAGKTTFVQFKPNFSALLHSKDQEMAVHRQIWKPIVANIAIALTGIGLAILLGKCIYSGLTTGRATFFFDQTNREKMRDKVEERLGFVRGLN